MRAGTMKDRIVITWPRELPAGPDDLYGPSTEYGDAATVWACVKPIEATEEFKQKGVQGGTQYDITIRYLADVTSECQITYRGRTLEIVSAIDVDGRRRELRIDAREYPARQGD